VQGTFELAVTGHSTSGYWRKERNFGAVMQRVPVIDHYLIDRGPHAPYLGKRSGPRFTTLCQPVSQLRNTRNVTWSIERLFGAADALA
jgi:hypothetical protein